MPRIFTKFSCVLIFIAAFIFIAVKRENPKFNRSEENERGSSGALEALDFWNRSRAYPDNDIPQDKYFRAYQTYSKKLKEFSKLTGTSYIWEPIGPLNLQGRSISVAINPLNPKTVYVGTASGGLWRSNTGGLGADWIQVNLGYPALGIGAIAIDPTDSNTIYIGTGEVYGYQIALGGLFTRTTRGSYGIGILKTTNGGATWNKSLDWTYNQQRGVERLAINPLNSSTIYAATTEGIYKSVDAGGSWNRVLNFILGNDIVINTDDTNKVMVSCGNFSSSDAGVYRTSSGGTSWNQVTGIPTFSGKTMLSMFQSNPNWVYASVADSVTGIGSLWRTTDFGDNWLQLCDNNTNDIFGVQGWYSHYVIVHPLNSNIVVWNSVSRSKSTDGGYTFNYISSGYSDNHSYEIDQTNSNILYAVNDDGIYRSTNFGSSYTNVGYGLQTGQIYNGFSCSTTDSLLAVAQSQDHIPGYRYTGSNTIWTSSAVDEAGWTAINPSNDNIIYAMYRFGTYVYKSTDRGASFAYNTSLGTDGAWNSPIAISRSNPNVVYAGNFNIHKTTNSGVSWFGTNGGTAPDNNPTLSMAISATNPDTVYVGRVPNFAHSSVLFTSNGGTSWETITGTLPDRYPMDIAVDPANSRIVYVAMGGFGSGHLYKSTNCGTNWIDITGTLPDIPTTAIAVDPFNSDNIYVGNDFGVYLSTNTGGSWLGFSEGLPDAVIIADLTISPSNRVLRAATHGNGVYERNLFDGTLTPTFDYRASIFNYPTDGQSTLEDLAIQNIKASFMNTGSQAQTDSFDVQYRILFNGIEKYSSIKHIPGLALREIRQVIFEGSFTPADTGTYTLQAISLAADNNHSNDTLKGTLIIFSPSIIKSTVIQLSQTYTEITVGSQGPTGDDAQMSLNLPFAFKYDNYNYDKIQISTNGWLEFGTGQNGTLRGLSTADQLGCCPNQNGLLFTTSRPTKLLSPWLDDLNVDAPNASVTYTTSGSAPNRVFVVQWANVLAYYTQTTTRLNFQIRLFENQNIIEYNYGPIQEGTFAGPDIGAMIGFKDHIGGDYRFYDIALGGSGRVDQGITNLSPLTDWPGSIQFKALSNSCYRIYAGATIVNVPVENRWNLVSLPVKDGDSTVANVFPSAISGTTYEYTGGGYQQAETLISGKGYWTKFPGAENRSIVGKALYSIPITLRQGWNLIGSIDHEIPAPAGSIINSSVFGYSGGYKIVNTLVPGKGYWVKANSNGAINLGSEMAPKSNVVNLNNFSELTITDKIGRNQTLYISGDADKLNLNYYEMPPVPPAGAFDVRFTGNRIAESADSDIPKEVPILVNSAEYPLTFNWNLKGTLRGVLKIGKDEIKLSTNGSLQISNPKAPISIIITGIQTAPKEYALEQNYPNPFNPTTTIHYQLPENSRVVLKIFTILGQEIKTLIDEVQEAGYKSYEFDANSLASGVYIYRLSAGKYSSAKKMIIMK